MLKAARSGNPAPSSSFASLERSLDRTIEFLTRREGTPEAKALLIEARRLRSVVLNWRSIPPAPDVHDEMLDRVLLLSTQAGAELGDAPDDDLKTEIDPGLGGMMDEQTVVTEPKLIHDENTEVYALDFEPRLYALEQGGLQMGAPPAPAPKAAASPERVVIPQQRAAPPAERAVAAYAAYPPLDDGSFAKRTPDASPRAIAGGPEYPAYPPAQEGPYAVYPPAPRLEQIAEPYPPLHGYPPADPYAPEPRTAYPSSPIYPQDLYPAAPAPGVTPTTGRRAAQPVEEQVNDAPLAPDTEITVRPVKLPEKIAPEIVLITEPYSDRADVYRALRRKLASSNNPRVIAVTSSGPGEGKTTSAINLALAMREGARGKVLLLEANVRSPAISKVLGFEPPECFVEQITRHREDPRLPWVVVEPLPQFHVLAVDPKVKHAPLLDPVAFTNAMDRLKRAGYEYVVVDTPPVIGSFEVNMIADNVSGVLFSAITMKSKKSAIKKAIEQVMPAPVLGVLVLDA